MAAFLEVIRSTLAEVLGGDDGVAPAPPEAASDAVAEAASAGIALLLDYQGPNYAQLYVMRLKRFVGRPGVDDALLVAIAALMAERMAYEDSIKLAREALIVWREGRPARGHVKRLRLDEMVSALPEIIADPVLDGLDRIGWLHKTVAIRFGAATRRARLRRRIESWFRRWRPLSVRQRRERVWVERWLHMIDRSLTKQPAAAMAVAQTATMVQGSGDHYRHGLAAWNALIDRLVKPTLEGDIVLPDLVGAIAQARAAAAADDPHHAALMDAIARLRTQAQPPVAA